MSAVPEAVLVTAKDRTSDVRLGRLSDIPFLVREIAAGAARGHFSPTLGQPEGKVRVLGWCLKAMLRTVPGGRSITGWNFLVVRSGSQAVGAILSETRRDSSGALTTLIGYVVVERSYRRQSVATQMVRAVVERAPAQRIVCACAPASKAMIGLLQSLRFKPQQRAPAMAGLVAPYLFQYQKV